MGICISRTVGCLWLPALTSPREASRCFLPLSFYRSGDFSLLFEFLSFFSSHFFLGGGYADWQSLTHFWNYSNNSTGEGKEWRGGDCYPVSCSLSARSYTRVYVYSPITLKGGHHLFRGFVSQRSKSKWRVWDLKLQTKGRPRCCIRSPINFSWGHTMDHGAWSKMIFEILLLAFFRKQIPWVYFN